MLFYRRRRGLLDRFQLVLRSFLQKKGLPFANVLPEEKIQQAFDEEGIDFACDDDDRVYTPALTLWAFLSQVLFKDEHRSCAAAVARVVTLLVALGRKPCSDNTGAYCRARAKLSQTVIRRLACDLASGCEDEVPQPWLWYGRHVKIPDGSTLNMPDTPENQKVFPQQKRQKEGVGFPIARILAVFSLATGMMMNLEIGPYAGKETGETALLRKRLDAFNAGDIFLGDCIFASYFMIALLRERGVDFVGRQHPSRITDFRRGERLGRRDHVVEWKRPDRPEWMDQETYDRMPKTLRLRELEVQVDQAGFRPEPFVVVTTLTDAKAYPAADIADLYRQRWNAELDLRSIKQTLGMDVLRCKSPEMVRKEIYTHMLAYNLIRQTMLQAARRSEANLVPGQLSFTAAMQKIAASWAVVLVCDTRRASKLIEVHLDQITSHQVGNRPDRVEPRAVKRRPKPHRLLNMTRDEARNLLRGGVDPYEKQK